MAVNTGVLRGGPRKGQYSKSVAGSADVTLDASPRCAIHPSMKAKVILSG